MQFVLLVYADQTLLDELSPQGFDAEMRQCLRHADQLQERGTLLDFKQLEPAATARSVRVRAGRTRIVDGPFAETKELLAGFNLIEAESIDEAVKIAQEFPWTRYGSIEVRPVCDLGAVRRRVGA